MPTRPSTAVRSRTPRPRASRRSVGRTQAPIVDIPSPPKPRVRVRKLVDFAEHSELQNQIETVLASRATAIVERFQDALHQLEERSIVMKTQDVLTMSTEALQKLAAAEGKRAVYLWQVHSEVEGLVPMLKSTTAAVLARGPLALTNNNDTAAGVATTTMTTRTTRTASRPTAQCSAVKGHGKGKQPGAAAPAPAAAGHRNRRGANASSDVGGSDVGGSGGGGGGTRQRTLRD